MSTNINIVVKDKDTPVPDTGVITPDTGRYTNTNSNSTSMEGGMIAFTIVLSSLLLLSIALIFFSRIFRKKAINTTTNSTTKNANLYSSNNKTNSIATNSITKKANLFRTLGLLLFIFTATTGIVANILKNTSFPTYATDTPLDITTSDTTITVVREDGPAFAVASAEITLNEATPAGYNLYVYGPDGNKFTSTTTTAAIDTVAEHNSIISNNTYGVANTTNEPLITDAVWNPVGDTEDNAELIATSSNATNVGDKITIYYGILVDETLPAGIYTGSIEYKAYTRTYTITYDANGGTFDDDTTTTTQYIAKGSSIGTLPDEPEREGYTFKGWFAEGSDQQVTTDTVPTEDITYYAKWKKNCNNNATTVGTGNAATDAVCMQDINSDNYLSFLNSMTEDAHYNLIDSRDEKVYTVSKLKDGRIWMTTNLDLTGGTKLTYEDTNIAEDYVLPTENGFGEDNTLPVSSIETGFLRKNSAGLYNSNNAECGNQPCYSYYTWVAATAGSELNNDDEFREAPYSICPSGWMLPKGGSFNDNNLLSATSYKRSDYYRLFVAYGMNTSDAYANDLTTPTASDVYEMIKPGTGPNLFGDSGVIDTNRFWSTSSYYWTSLATYESTLMFGSEAFYSVVSPTLIRSNLHYYYNFGYSIRCIVAAPKVTVTFDANANGGVINGKSSDSVDIAIGSRLAYLPEATRDNYTFVGWFTEADGGEEVTESIKPLADVTYYAHWIRNTYTITFDANEGIAIGIPTITINAGDTLGSNIPSASRVGYDFLGWYPAESEERITANTIPTINTTYYAHWEERPLTIQNIDDIAAALPNIGDTITVPDERDGTEYLVGRLADGRIWMLDNLALDLTDPEVQANMNETNTNASATSIGALFSGTEHEEEEEGEDGLAWVPVNTDWDDASQSDRLYTSPLIYAENKGKTMAEATYAGYEEDDADWLVGVYYNFCAASAGSYCYSEYSYPAHGVEFAVDDICPAGWHMPISDHYGDNPEDEYSILYDAYMGEADQDGAFIAALRLPLAGEISMEEDSFSNTFHGVTSHFWTASVYSAEAYTLAIEGGGVHTDGVLGYQYYSERGLYGYSVRCVAEPRYPQSGIFLQDTSAIDAAVPNVGDIVNAVDSRDGTEYLVGRLADNRIWLLDNLALDLTATDASINITAENTNASAVSLHALFNGGGTGNLARSAVTESDHYSHRDPYIKTTYKNTTMKEAFLPGYVGIDRDWTVGVYYNSCAAYAGSYCNSDASSQMIVEDICPAGWRLPEGDEDNGEYKTLYLAYGPSDDWFSWDRNIRMALRIPLSGYYYGGSFRNIGVKNFFTWSSGINYYSGYSYDAPVRCIMKQPRPTQSNISLQDTEAIVEAVPNVGDIVNAVDSRDGTEYLVGKLADGRIWMLDNLALDLTAQNASINITAANTNASTASLTALFNGNGTNNLARSAVSADWADSYNEPLINTEYISESRDEMNDWPTGVYYNYCAASAGSYCYDSYPSPDDIDAAEDICPFGWRMPTGGEDDQTYEPIGEYAALYDAYQGDSNRDYVFHSIFRTPLSGYFNYGSVVDRGSYGYFWSSTGHDSEIIYLLYVGIDSVGPSYVNDGYYRTIGNSVRCIMKND